MPINYNNYLANNVTTSTVVYNPTTSGVQATMVGLLICNNTANTAVANVTLANTTSYTANIARNIIIPSGTSLNIIDSSKIIVGQGNFVNVSSSFSVDVIVSSIEVT
jgi:hypothetical protein